MLHRTMNDIGRALIKGTRVVTLIFDTFLSTHLWDILSILGNRLLHREKLAKNWNRFVEALN